MFPKFWVSKIIKDKTRAWVSRFSLEIFLLHSTKTFRKGTFLCFASEKFPEAKSLWKRGNGDYEDFPSKFFCLTVPKSFSVKSTSVSFISGNEK